MMGYPCLRLNGDFFVSWDSHRHALVVKPDRQSVADLISDGRGEPFAPSGRPFSEWISIPATASDGWTDLLDAAFDHAVERAARPHPKRPR